MERDVKYVGQAVVLFIVFVSMGFALGYMYACQKNRKIHSRVYWIQHLNQDDLIWLFKNNAFVLRDRAVDEIFWYDKEVTESNFREEIEFL